MNTHSTNAFYEQFLASEAFALAQRFEFYYTPKSASWLNMIECKFSVIERQCLDRRIPTIERLKSYRWSKSTAKEDQNQLAVLHLDCQKQNG